MSLNFPTVIGNDLILNTIVCMNVLILVLFIGVLLFISLIYCNSTALIISLSSKEVVIILHLYLLVLQVH